MYIITTYFWRTIGCQVQILRMNFSLNSCCPRTVVRPFIDLLDLFWSGYSSWHFKNHLKYLKHMEKSKDIWKQHWTQRKSKVVPFRFWGHYHLERTCSRLQCLGYDLSSSNESHPLPAVLPDINMHSQVLPPCLGDLDIMLCFKLCEDDSEILLLEHETNLVHAHTHKLYPTRIIWFWNLFSLRYVETKNACINLLMHFITLCCIPWFVRSLLTMKAGGISSISRIIRRASPDLDMDPVFFWQFFHCLFDVRSLRSLWCSVFIICGSIHRTSLWSPCHEPPPLNHFRQSVRFRGHRYVYGCFLFVASDLCLLSFWCLTSKMVVKCLHTARTPTATTRCIHRENFPSEETKEENMFVDKC